MVSGPLRGKHTTHVRYVTPPLVRLGGASTEYWLLKGPLNAFTSLPEEGEEPPHIREVGLGQPGEELGEPLCLCVVPPFEVRVKVRLGLGVDLGCGQALTLTLSRVTLVTTFELRVADGQQLLVLTLRNQRPRQPAGGSKQ